MELLRSALVPALAAAITAGCFSPKFEDGKIRCDETSGCPPGFNCWSDGRCHLGVEPSRPDASVPDATVADAGPVDAAPDDARGDDARAPDAAPIDAAIPDAAIPDAEVPDARPGDLTPPTIFDTAGGSARLGTTSVAGAARAIVTIGPGGAAGKMGAAGTPSIELGILPGIKVP